MRKQTLKIVLSLSVITILIGVGFAQQRKTTGEPVTITGKIGHMDRIGSYYVRSESPRTVLIIVNQDPKILEELKKTEKTVTIEGKLTEGADLVFVEKIDGKPYVGTRVIK